MNTHNDELPMMLTVADLINILHIGRNKAYQLVKDGTVHSLHIGRSIRIPRAAFEEYIQSAHP